jgi:hypothetical protein
MKHLCCKFLDEEDEKDNPEKTKKRRRKAQKPLDFVGIRAYC